MAMRHFCLATRACLPAIGILIVPISLATRAYAQSTAVYSLVDLGNAGNFGGGLTGLAEAINSSGQAVGELGITAFRTSPNGQPLSFTNPPMESAYNVGDGINTDGQIAITSSGYTGGNLAFRSDPSGTVLTNLGNLGAPSGQTNYGATAIGINDSGQVTGTSETTAGSYQAYRSSANGVSVTLTDLGTFSGNANLSSQGNSINKSGQVAGASDVLYTYSDGTTKTESNAFRSSANGQAVTLTDLGTLLPDPGENIGYSTSVATAINASGQAVGTSTYFYSNNGGITETYQSLAFISSADNQPVSLTAIGPSAGYIYSSASAINDQGEVVGYESGNSGGDQAMLYSSAISGVATTYNLNSLLDSSGSGFTVTQATGINDLGQITGIATDASGYQHAVLLNPEGILASASAPEPGAMLLVLTWGLPVASRFIRRRL